jgi:hypothetical protein
MRIELKCACGAQAVFEDAKETTCKVDFGQHHDAKGRRYLIEVRADDWQERHQACLASGVLGSANDQGEKA